MTRERAWFVANIFEVREQGKFLIRYQELHDDNKVLIEEDIDDKHIRPSPPFTDAKFKLLDKVDALVLDGWRIGGMITKVNSNNT